MTALITKKDCRSNPRSSTIAPVTLSTNPHNQINLQKKNTYKVLPIKKVNMKLILVYCVKVDNQYFSLYYFLITITLQFGGFTIGAEKLKIGELAEISNVTKRTIDYYTNLGLLEVERSSSNYRYYDRSSIDRLHFIEQCKKDGMSLDAIKKKILEKDTEEIDVLELRLKIKGLEKEVSELLAHLDKNDLKNLEKIKKNISHESLSLIQTLLVLIN